MIEILTNLKSLSELRALVAARWSYLMNAPDFTSSPRDVRIRM